MTQIVNIDSNRMLLRSINIKDAQEIFSYRSDAITNQYQGWIPKTITEVNDFIENRIAKEFNIPDTWYQLGIVEKETNKLIGDVGIHFIDEQQAEVGCTLNKTCHGKGYATEALKATINHLFTTLNKHRIVTSIDPLNIKSISLVERLGFRKEAHFKQSILINGEWVDDIVYAILHNEWKHFS